MKYRNRTYLGLMILACQQQHNWLIRLVTRRSLRAMVVVGHESPTGNRGQDEHPSALLSTPSSFHVLYRYANHCSAAANSKMLPAAKSRGKIFEGLHDRGVGPTMIGPLPSTTGLDRLWKDSRSPPRDS